MTGRAKHQKREPNCAEELEGNTCMPTSGTPVRFLKKPGEIISFSFSFYFSSYLSHLNYATVLNFFISALSSENIYWFLHLLPEGHTP